MASGGLLYGYTIGGDTNLSGALVSMSGQLVTQIQSAAGVLSLNGATGLLTFTSAPSPAGYIGISLSGTTIYVSGLSATNGALALATHTASGGGLGLGPDNSIWRTSANNLKTNATWNAVGYLTSNGGAGNFGTTDGFDFQLLSNNTIRWIVSNGLGGALIPPSDNTTDLGAQGNSLRKVVSYELRAPTGADLILSTSGGMVAARFGPTQNVSFASGIFYRDTGNYTPSGTASIAQLLATSGSLFTIATSNVVYTTGAQTINGVKTFNNAVTLSGNATISGDAVGTLWLNPTGASPVNLNLANGTVQFQNIGGTITAITNTVAAKTLALVNSAGGNVLIRNSAGLTTALFTDAGLVGIGTTSPTSLLHVSGGSLRVESGSIALVNQGQTSLNLTALAGTNQDAVLGLSSPNNNWAIRTDETSFNTSTLHIKEAAVSRMIFRPTGIGIGTTAPSGFFHVTGTSLFATAGGRVGIGTSTPGFALNVFDAGTEVMQLSTSKAAFNTIGDIGGSLIVSIGGVNRWTFAPGGAITSAGSQLGNSVPLTINSATNNPQSGDMTQWKSGSAVIASVNATGGAYFAGSVGIGTTSLGAAGTLTMASGLILGQSNVTGGGIAFGTSANVWSPATNQLALGTSGVTALTLGVLQDVLAARNVSAASGLFFADTGNYTRSGAASVAQLASLSGVLAASIVASTVGVSMLNGLSGALSLGTATAGASYPTFSLSGSTFFLSGTQGLAMFASGIVLGTSNVTGGGITFGDTHLSRSAAQSLTTDAQFAARSYVVAVSGAAIPNVGSSLTGIYNIDFTNSPALQTITVTGATLFSGINYVAGGAVTMRVNVSGANAAAVRFPVSWNNGWVTTVPTGLATGRFAVLTINTFTANDSGVAIAWAVAP